MKKRIAIEKTPGVCGGRPCFAGTRMPPETLWGWFDLGDSVATIQRNYPTMTRAHIALSRQLWRAAKAHFGGELRKAARWSERHREDESHAGAEIAFALEQRADRLARESGR